MDVTKPVSRRTFLASTAATGAVAATASLHLPEARASQADANVVTLQFWETYLPEDAGRYHQLVAGFEAAHPNIKVNMTLRPGANFEQVTIPAAAASGTMPDVFHHNTYVVADWANRGWLLPLNQFVQKEKFDLTDFWAQELTQMSWKG